jgi:hypothetical protein
VESLDEKIFIRAPMLCAYLYRGEEQAAKTKHKRGAVRPSTPWVRKRKRENTPPEELDPYREKRFRKEDRAEQVAEKDDLSYKSSSASDRE